MRDYAQIRPRFWTHGTGKTLRHDLEARMVALYLVSAPTSNLIGMYYLPVSVLSHELGLTIEGASEALRRVCDTGFAAYDDDTEYVWVVNMAREQVGDEPNFKDKRIIGVRNELKKHAKCPFYQHFCNIYADVFGLQTASPIEAPSKPLEGPSISGSGSRAESGSGTESGTRVTAQPPVDVMGMQLAIGAAALDLGWTPAPQLSLNHQRIGAQRVAEAAAARGLPQPEVARALAVAALKAARERGKPDSVGFLLASVDPWAPAGAQAPSRGRLAPAPATTGKDFEDAPDVMTQIERWK